MSIGKFIIVVMDCQYPFYSFLNLQTMTFGKTLQKLRRLKEITQRDVAKKINMDFSYFSKLENDKLDSNPTSDTIDKIATALECTEEEKNELLASAGRATQEMKQASRIVSENPQMRQPLGKLFRAAIHLTPERLNQLAEEVERETRNNQTQNLEESEK